MYKKEDVERLQKEWESNPRWKGIERPYGAVEVIKMQGSHVFDYPLARMGAKKLWKLLSEEPFIRALGAMSGNQAVQQVQAGLKTIYASGWQVAADMNDALETYPDQSLYPILSMPHLIKRLNNALRRADQIQHLENNNHTDWYVPIVADAEAGFGGPLNCFELIKAMIEAGAAAIHLEDQLSSLKKCGHMGGKVIVPANIFIEKLIIARFAADIMNIPTLFIARTDSLNASLIRSDSDPIDQPFISGEQSVEGYFKIKGGIDYAVKRSLAFAPYADLIWCETAAPDLKEAEEFAKGIHEKYPGKWLAYNCSPSFNWRRNLNENQIRDFQEKLGEMGYKFQFVTLAGFHTLNAAMFDLAHQYADEGMAAYSRFQEREFTLEKEAGFRAIKHQHFVGAGYYDQVNLIAHRGESSTSAMSGSTEEAQFH